MVDKWFEKWLEAINKNVCELGLIVIVVGIVLTFNTCSTWATINSVSHTLDKIEKIMEARDADK